MPLYKNVNLTIHTPNDHPDNMLNSPFTWAQAHHSALPEHGTVRLRNTPKISSFIQSTTNSPFAVSITILDSYEPKNKGDDRESLAAYVYFDGREKEETATLLRRGVETWISSRWVEVNQGELAEREFVFREVGLETYLGGLDISKSEKEKETLAGKSGKKGVNRRHSMPAKMQGADGDDSDDEEKAISNESAGQIRIDLFRVRCEGPVRRGVWGGMFKDGLGEDAEGSGAAIDISHTAGFSEPKPLDKETVSTQSVSHLDPEGVVYASFVFFYRSERQLQKMGLIKPKNSVPVTTTLVVPAKAPKPVDPKKSKVFSGFREAPGNDLKDSSKNTFKSLIGGDDSDSERIKTGDESKIGEEIEDISGRVGRIQLKRSHSTSDLQATDSKKSPPGTPQNMMNGTFATPGREPLIKQVDTDTPIKKRRGSRDDDVKSPVRGIELGAVGGIFGTFGSSNKATTGFGTQDMAGFGGKVEFGGMLGSRTVQMEEEIL